MTFCQPIMRRYENQHEEEFVPLTPQGLCLKRDLVLEFFFATKES